MIQLSSLESINPNDLYPLQFQIPKKVVGSFLLGKVLLLSHNSVLDDEQLTTGRIDP